MKADILIKPLLATPLFIIIGFFSRDYIIIYIGKLLFLYASLAISLATIIAVYLIWRKKHMHAHNEIDNVRKFEESLEIEKQKVLHDAAMRKAQNYLNELSRYADILSRNGDQTLVARAITNMCERLSADSEIISSVKNRSIDAHISTQMIAMIDIISKETKIEMPVLSRLRAIICG